MFGEGAESASTGGGGLFDSLSPEEDRGQLFPSEDPPEPVKEQPVSKPSNSLSGGFFSDEEEGLFGDDPPKTTPTAQKKLVELTINIFCTSTYMYIYITFLHTYTCMHAQVYI